jgi:signal transduction histidine kinase
MSINLIEQKEYLSSLTIFNRNYLHYTNVKDLVKYAFGLMSQSPVISKLLFYELDTETFNFNFIVSNLPECNGDQIFNFLIKNNVIVRTLAEVENSYFFDELNHEYYACIPILSYDGILGIIVISSLVVNLEGDEVLTERLNTASHSIGLAINALKNYVDKEHYKDLQNQIVAIKTIEFHKNVHNLKLKMDQLTTNLNRSIPHEIRTPFLHIIGLSDMLLKHPEIDKMDDAEEIKDIIKDLNIAAKRLNAVLDNYIIYANLVTKSFSSEEIEKENRFYSEDVDSILFELANELAYKYNRSADIIINVEPASLVGSPSIINKLFFELIDNAFKFSSDGTKVEITAKLIDEILLVKISDHGCGMTDEEIKGIGPFVQYNREKFEQQGLGLGLAIAIKILAILNGDIDIISKKGIYTEVNVKLRIYKVPVV